jgi:hypothetical protein
MTWGQSRTSITGTHVSQDTSACLVRPTQDYYTKEVSEKYNMLESKPSILPMPPTNYYRDADVASPADKTSFLTHERETFRAILKSVNFSCMCQRTRVDNAMAINVFISTAGHNRLKLVGCAPSVVNAITLHRFEDF